MRRAFARCAISPGFAVLALAQGLAGLASGIALPAAYALAAEIAPPGRAAAALGRVLTGWTLALVFGVTLSAVMADLLHWRATFVLIAGAAGLLIWPTRRLPNRSGNTITLPWAALAQPGVVPGLLAQLALMTGFYGTYSFLGAHLFGLGLEPTHGAVPVLAYGIGFGLSGRFDPWLDRRGYSGAGPRVFVAVAGALGGMAVFNDSVLALTLVFFAWGLANHLALGLIVGRLTRVGGSRKGAVLGLNSAVTYLAVVVGAAGFAPVFAMGGLALCAAIGATLAICLAFEARWRPVAAA
ncbi:MAG: MFS transporter [Pseudomonadota bacterium]